MKSVVKKEHDVVNIEIAISLNSLKEYGLNKLEDLKFNAYRINRTEDKDSEYLALFPLYSKGFHQPSKFGKLLIDFPE